MSKESTNPYAYLLSESFEKSVDLLTIGQRFL